MKIAVSATGGSMAALVDKRFSRCAYFVIFDSETMKFTAFSNPISEYSGGSNLTAAREISKYGAEVLLTGRVSEDAQRALDNAGIKVKAVLVGKVREAVENYLKSRA